MGGGAPGLRGRGGGPGLIVGGLVGGGAPDLRGGGTPGLEERGIPALGGSMLGGGVWSGR